MREVTPQMTRTLEQLQAAGSELVEDCWQFGNEQRQLEAQRDLIAEAYAAGRASVPQQWQDAREAALSRRRLSIPPADVESGKLTVWQSPSGKLHLRRSCSGAGPARNMTLVQMTPVPWDHEKHCRCLRHQLTLTIEVLERAR
jgi:hypothetical protein